MVGDTVSEYIKKAAEPIPDKAQIEQQKETALRPLTVKDGTEPMELESTIRYLCTRYIGVNKSEGKLREGQNRLNSLKREFLPKIMASNPHYLMRGLEARNLMDVAEVHLQASLQRKETWAMHIRLDYPKTENEGKLAYSKLVNGKPVFEIRALDPVKFPDNHKEER
jgi:succinate dehydrogenase/fumarate reductase flavoprotein subunit